MRIHLAFFASLRDQAGVGEELRETEATSVSELYEEVSQEHGFELPIDLIRFAVNDRFISPGHEIQNGDRVVFIPPVSGG